jgi:hypothetical protein
MEQNVEIKINIEILGRLAVLVRTLDSHDIPVFMLTRRDSSATSIWMSLAVTSGPRLTRSWRVFATLKSTQPLSFNLRESDSCLTHLALADVCMAVCSAIKWMLDEDRRVYGDFLLSDVSRLVVGMEEVDNTVRLVPAPASG